MTLALEVGLGYQAAVDFRLQVGSAYFDDVEADLGWSLAEPDDGAVCGRWVRVGSPWRCSAWRVAASPL